MVHHMRFSGLKASVDYKEDEVGLLLAKKLGISERDLQRVSVFKQSVDARKFPVTYSLTVDFEISQRLVAGVQKKGAIERPNYTFKPVEGVKFQKPPVVIGFGPAGIFAAYYLAMIGANPLVIERGEAVDARTRTVDLFWKTGILNPESNVQFGEGGAGAFSDGKLTTRVKDPLARAVFEILVHHGAPARILIDQKPHVGTDLLVEVVQNLRRQIEAWGGVFHFGERFEGLRLSHNLGHHHHKRLVGIETNRGTYDTDTVFLAIGHSARDTYKVLWDQGVKMSAKPFAMGLRIEHPQSMINKAQYGPQANHPRLGAADYAVKTQAMGRGVYSFCMCPGGHVINASSGPGQMVVNGMSYHARDGENANSALLVTLNPEDFGATEENPMAGIHFQEALEAAAHKTQGDAVSARSGGKALAASAPVQLVGDFVRMKMSKDFGEVKPSVQPDCHFVDFNLLLPKVMAEALRAAIPVFGRQIEGFDREDAVLTGIETRSSSPLRIVRTDQHESISVKGLYPIGEGAGYAGGITSAAVDGLSTVHSLLNGLKG